MGNAVVFDVEISRMMEVVVSDDRAIAKVRAD
jgi:hypothetical protein